MLIGGGLTVQVQGKNIIAYAEYLVQRAIAYGATKVDYVRAGEGRLKKLTVDKGLLRETESVQDQIRALLKCDVSAYGEPFPVHSTLIDLCYRLPPKLYDERLCESKAWHLFLLMLTLYSFLP
jgi:hypothetical protein